jgi:hypothetical protein
MPLAKHPSVNIHMPDPLQMFRGVMHSRFQIFMSPPIHVVASCVIKTCRYVTMILVNRFASVCMVWLRIVFFPPNKCWYHLQNTITPAVQFSWSLVTSLQIKLSSHADESDVTTKRVWSAYFSFF